MNTLESLFQDYCAAKYASSPHLPTLRALAALSRTCVEFGTKHGASAVALLLGCPGEVWSYDIKSTPKAEALKEIAGTRWHYVIGDSRLATVPACDLLFIDSMHNYEHVTAELAVHANKVKKFLVFHDTITFGSVGAVDESGKHALGTLGIRPAIDDLMIRDRTWFIKSHAFHSHGLLVLERLILSGSVFPKTDVPEHPLAWTEKGLSRR